MTLYFLTTKSFIINVKKIFIIKLNFNFKLNKENVFLPRPGYNLGKLDRGNPGFPNQIAPCPRKK